MRSVYVCLTLCLLGLATFASAQVPDQAVDQGVKAFQAYSSSDIDSVNLQNGNLIVKIPVFTLPQRGGKPIKYSLVWNGKQLKPRTVCTNQQCVETMQMFPGVNPVTGMGVQLQEDDGGAGAGVLYLQQQWQQCTSFHFLASLALEANGQT